MKYLRILPLILGLMLPAGENGRLHTQPLPEYELSVANPVMDGTTYQFDICLRRVGTTGFRVGNSQFIITFNGDDFLTPAITRVPGSEEIGGGYFFDAVLTGNEIRVSVGGNGSYASAADVSTGMPGTRISTIRLSGIPVPLPSPQLTWVNVPIIVRTGISEIQSSNNYRDITDPSGDSHLNGGGDFSRISGYKFEDNDGNGIWDAPMDPPLDGWTIYASGAGGTDSVVTGSGPWPEGYYEFVNLTPGTYTLSEKIQTGWSATIAPSTPVTVSPGEHSMNNNFGNFFGPTATGSAFNDYDGDGVKEPGELPLAGWEVRAEKSGGGGTKTRVTNAAGEFVFTFLPADAGEWIVSEFIPPGWIRTLPAATGTYTIDVGSGSGITGLTFGNFRESIISGMKYDDLDGDSVRSPGEPGLEGWIITLIRDDLHYDTALTLADGGFLFDSLPSGTYRVVEEQRPGWIRLSPGDIGEYTFVVDTGGYFFTDSDFGNFRYGTVSGEVYYDLNHNGVRDPGESGMTGVEVRLDGPRTSRHAISGPGGIWNVDDVLADELTITESVPPGHHLTQPGSGAYAVTISSGTVLTGLHFGNSSAADTQMFRTISYDSLVESRDRAGKLLKPERRKPDKVEFSMSFTNTTGENVDGLRLRVLVPIFFGDSLFPFVVDPEPAGIDFITTPRYVYITWDGDIPPDSTVTIHGWGQKPKRYPHTYHHWLKDGVVKNKVFSVITLSDWSIYRLPLPNRMNVCEDAMLRGGFPQGIFMGVDRNDNPKFFSWARITRLSHLKKSILDRFVEHSLPGRNFYEWDNGKRMTREQKRISPRKHNNRLFADALSLRISIVASQMGILPPGLGELILEDPGNALSGRTLLEISARADSLLTNWVDRTIGEYHNMDTTLRKINESFEGPIDTVSFASQLRLTGTRRLQDVPYLRANPLTLPATITPREPAREQIPESFTLYQNYPNPFNPWTTIEFALPEPSRVSVRVFNVLGEEMGTLMENEFLEEGIHDVDFEGDDLPSGVYFYRLSATTTGVETGLPPGTYHRVMKMILMK